MSPRPPEIASKTNTVSASSRTIASLGVSWSRLPSEAVEYTEKPSLDNFLELLEVLRDAQGMSSHEDAVNMEVQTRLLATLAELKKLDNFPFLPGSRLTVVREEPSTPTPIWSWIDQNNPPGSYLKDPRKSSHEACWPDGIGTMPGHGCVADGKKLAVFETTIVLDQLYGLPDPGCLPTQSDPKSRFFKGRPGLEPFKARWGLIDPEDWKTTTGAWFIRALRLVLDSWSTVSHIETRPDPRIPASCTQEAITSAAESALSQERKWVPFLEDTEKKTRRAQKRHSADRSGSSSKKQKGAASRGGTPPDAPLREPRPNDIQVLTSHIAPMDESQ